MAKGGSDGDWAGLSQSATTRMSHFGFVVPPFLGHLNPMGVLATALFNRGHEVTLFGIAETAAMVGGGAWTVVAVGGATHPPGAMARLDRHMAAPRGLGLMRIMADMTRTTEMLCRDLPAACRSEHIDALVTDQLEPAGGLVASHLRLPFVSVANALPINRDPTVPPPFTNWGYDPSEWGLKRNLGGYRVADLLMRPLGRTIARQAQRLDLPPRHRLEDCLSPYAEVTQMIPELDFPRNAVADTMHPCGPFRLDENDAAIEPLLGNGRPLVFASLGTLQGGRAASFAMIAEACALLDLHLVIAHRGRLTAKQCAGFRGAPVVRAFVPQSLLLRHAALAIVNGGLNTVLDALAAGVPTLALPIAFEQGAIAARLAHSGAGLVLPHGRLSVARLTASLARLIREPQFRDRARALSRATAQAGGAELAASIIETVATTGRPVSRATMQVRDLANRVEPA